MDEYILEEWGGIITTTDEKGGIHEKGGIARRRVGWRVSAKFASARHRGQRIRFFRLHTSQPTNGSAVLSLTVSLAEGDQYFHSPRLTFYLGLTPRLEQQFGLSTPDSGESILSIIIAIEAK